MAAEPELGSAALTAPPRVDAPRPPAPPARRVGPHERPGAASTVEVSVVLPCLNEEATVATCVVRATRCLRALGVAGEVIVADNGSVDGSQALAAAAGARVVDVPTVGYGAALAGGIQAAAGTFVIMADADDSYNLEALGPFVDALRSGADLVMGNRFRGGIEPGSMPALHRYLGNPVLTRLGRMFFHSASGDFHCGIRGFRRQAIVDLGLRTTGMEFASEMVVKATLEGLRVVEVPTTLRRDGRTRPPHLRTWRDGWRHLRFLLLYSPRWLFLYPGVVLLLGGLATGVALLAGPIRIGGIGLDINALVYSMVAVLTGAQAILFAAFALAFATNEGLLPPTRGIERAFGVVTLERGLVTGMTVLLVGVGCAVYGFASWSARGFGSMNPEETIRYVVPAATALVLGFELILSSFFLSILGLSRR